MCRSPSEYNGAGGKQFVLLERSVGSSENDSMCKQC